MKGSSRGTNNKSPASLGTCTVYMYEHESPESFINTQSMASSNGLRCPVQLVHGASSIMQVQGRTRYTSY